MFPMLLSDGFGRHEGIGKLVGRYDLVGKQPEYRGESFLMTLVVGVR
jgi:hypothetical protein